MRLLLLAALTALAGCGGGGDDGDLPGGDGGGSDDAPTDEQCPDLAGTVVDVSPSAVSDGVHFYFAESDTLHRMPVGGGARETLATLAGNAESPLALGAQHLFVVAVDRAWRVPLVGGAPEDLGAVAGQVVQVASDGGAFYTAAFTTDEIELRRAASPGGATTVLTAITTEGVTGLASDGMHLYWLGAQPASLRRVPIGGGSAELIDDSRDGVAANIMGYELVRTGSELLWSVTYQSFPDGRVFAYPLAGGARRTVTDRGLTTGLDAHDGVAYVALTGGSESRIAAVPLDGAPRTLVACVPDRVLSIDVTSAGVYVPVDGERRVFPLLAR